MWANKGVTKRTARQQAELAVRILDGRHAGDLIQRVSDELGTSAGSLGPVDMTRNPLRAAVDRLGKAYTRPPMVTVEDAHGQLCLLACGSLGDTLVCPHTSPLPRIRTARQRRSRPSIIPTTT